MVSYEGISIKDIKKLKKHGFSDAKPKSKLEEIRYVGKCNLVLYKTGKLLLQGKTDAVDETKKIMEYMGIIKINKLKGLAVGSDETLKGDTFGGIVVCAFKADDNIRKELEILGVKDSKELTKPQIVELAQKLVEQFPQNYHVENIFPKEYNKMNSKMNVTEILDNLHDKCYKKLSRTALHIVDLYPGCNVGNVREQKAESKYLEVAAASIIGRYFGLMQIRELEQKAGFFIPFGSSNVGPGLLEIKKKSLKAEDFVKIKFRNVQDFFF